MTDLTLTADDKPPAGALPGFLSNPGQTVVLSALPGQFAHAAITLTVPGAAALANDPSQPGKVRGALGEVLKTSASPQAVSGSPCPWTPPCALDLFYRTQGRMTAGLEIPKPFVLSLTPVGPDLEVACTLFGLAADWAGQVGDALTAGLRRGLRHPTGGRLQVADRRIEWRQGVGGLEGLGGLSRIELDFLTPFALRRGHKVHAALPSLITGIGNRTSGLARWMGLDVDADWQAIKAAAGAVSVLQSTVAGESWRRASRRQGLIIGMAGFRGRILIEGELGLLMPLLVLGQITHAGTHAALGMGRYRIVDLEVA